MMRLRRPSCAAKETEEDVMETERPENRPNPNLPYTGAPPPPGPLAMGRVSRFSLAAPVIVIAGLVVLGAVGWNHSFSTFNKHYTTAGVFGVSLVLAGPLLGIAGLLAKPHWPGWLLFGVATVVALFVVIFITLPIFPPPPGAN